jgi:hypothetical protein
MGAMAPASDQLGTLDLAAMSDLDLAVLARGVSDEFRRRALAAGDPEAVADEAFSVSFGSDGLARAPRVSNGFVVCAGGKEHTSAASHRCRFAVLGEHWVWDSPDCVHDEIRPTGKGASTRSVSLVPAIEGLVVEMITSKARGGRHERTGVNRYVVRDGAVVEVPVESGPRIPDGGHR